MMKYLRISWRSTDSRNSQTHQRRWWPTIPGLSRRHKQRGIKRSHCSCWSDFW